jgi:hypothetical protein
MLSQGWDKMPTGLGGKIRGQKERVQKNPEADCASHYMPTIKQDGSVHGARQNIQTNQITAILMLPIWFRTP